MNDAQSTRYLRTLGDALDAIDDAQKRIESAPLGGSDLWMARLATRIASASVEAATKVRLQTGPDQPVRLREKSPLWRHALDSDVLITIGVLPDGRVKVTSWKPHGFDASYAIVSLEDAIQRIVPEALRESSEVAQSASVSNVTE